MCGVFGFVARDGKGPELGRLKRIAAATMARGPHAWGMAWIDSRGRLKCFKQTGRIVDALGLLAMAADARMLIGHCRYATQGAPENNLNNHPHPADGGWIVHNGTIPDYRGIIEAEELFPVSDCDSEVLGLLIEKGSGSLLGRSIWAARHVRGPLALLGLWSRPARLVALKAGNPLCLGVEAKRYYLGSLPDGLPGEVRAFKDGQALEFTASKTHVQEFAGSRASRPQREGETWPSSARRGLWA